MEPKPAAAGGAPGAILFICGQNAIRSPMAEAIARNLLPANVYVRSAGVRAGEPDPFVEAALAEIGLTLGRHQPHTLEDLEDDYFDLVISLSPQAHHAALELTRSSAVEVIYWPMMDPTVTQGTREQILDGYRDLRDRLIDLIETHFVRREGTVTKPL